MFLCFVLPFLSYHSISKRPKITSYSANNIFRYQGDSVRPPNLIYHFKQKIFSTKRKLSIKSKPFNEPININTLQKYQSISLIDCHFNNIQIKTDKTSVIFIKKADISIEDSDFLRCFSRNSNNGIICHAIYLDEYTSHDSNITRCNFTNNGDPSSDKNKGTIIFSRNSNNLRIIDSQFLTTNEISTRSIESVFGKSINLIGNAFLHMTSAVFIEKASNVEISSCTFDENRLENENPEKDYIGSSLNVNLNQTLVFTNNTIMNHSENLSCVISFNKENSQNKRSPLNFVNENDNLESDNDKRTVLISDTTFKNNRCTKNFEGSGIGLYVDDSNEESRESLNIEFYDCKFIGNGDKNKESAAGVFGFSSKLSCISFVNCFFESNVAHETSGLIDIKNGANLRIERCTVTKISGNGFLKFRAVTPKNKKEVEKINVLISSSTFSSQKENSQTNFISIDKNDDNYQIDSLNIYDCTFDQISTDKNSFLFDVYSNSVDFQNNKVSLSPKSKNSNLFNLKNPKMERLNVNYCDLNNCQFGFLSTKASEAKFVNTVYENAGPSQHDSVVASNSEEFLCENCSFIYSGAHSSTTSYRAIYLEQSSNAVINNVTFKNCWGPGTLDGHAICSVNPNSNSNTLTISSCVFEECGNHKSVVFTENKVINFIDNKITFGSSDDGTTGLLIKKISQITVDGCTFTNCKPSTEAGHRGGGIEYEKPEDDFPNEMINIMNTEFQSCSGDACAMCLMPRYAQPTFTNITVANSPNSHYSIVIIIDSVTQYSQQGEVLFQNSSFINILNTENIYLQSSKPCPFIIRNSLIGNLSAPLSNTNDISLIRVDQNVNYFECVNTTFDQRGITNNFPRALYIEIPHYLVDNCSFFSQGKPVGDNGMHAIFSQYLLDTELIATISSCTFVNWKSQSDNNYVVKCENHIINLINNSFLNSETGISGGIYIDISCTLLVDGCNFIKCGRTNIGGGLHYKNDLKREVVTISNCLFDQCVSDNSGAMRLFMYSAVPVLYNNTYTNIQGTYVVSIIYDYNVIFKTFVIEKNSFIGNSNTASDCGGCGLWISNAKLDGNVYRTSIDFYDCNFINNQSPNCGGGFGLGISSSVKPTNLQIIGCNFTGNSCKSSGSSDGGGALWLRTSAPCTIINTVFINNKSSDNVKSDGAAIFLSFTSSLFTMDLINSSFINNSCAHASSLGHALYAPNLNGPISITRCNFTDNGYDNQTPNSIIYTSSQLLIEHSIFSFTDKSKSFSRALFVGQSSNLNVRFCSFCNFSIKSQDGYGGTLYYSYSTTRDSESLSITDSTFINNSADFGSDLYLSIYSEPTLRNCSFTNRYISSDLIILNFFKGLNTPKAIAAFDQIHCIECSFNGNKVLNILDNGNENIMDELLLIGCQLISNEDLVFASLKDPKLTINGSQFKHNSINNYIFSINSGKETTISNCIFEGNQYSHTNNLETNSISAIFVKQSSELVISDTIFSNEEIQFDENMPQKTSILNVNTDMFLSNLSFVDCSTFKYAIYYHLPEKRSGTSIFSVENCTFDNSGAVFIENQISQIIVVNSTIKNTINGLFYDPLEKKLITPTEFIQIENCTFDSMTNCSCSINALDDLQIRNNTVKNCKNDKEKETPNFHVMIQKETKKELNIEKFTFESNEIKNDNNKNKMNGGGIGLVVELPNQRGKKEDIFINFIECCFISNKATLYGGAFAFFKYEPLQEMRIIIKFSKCNFVGNSCDTEKGGALYLECDSVEIEDCIFESDMKDDNSAEELLIPNEDRSVVFIEGVSSNDLMITECTFDRRQGMSICISNCFSNIIFSECTFSFNRASTEPTSIIQINTEKEINFVNNIFNDNQGYIINIVSKEIINFDNCTFDSNKGILESSKDSESESTGKAIHGHYCIYASNEKSILLNKCSFTNIQEGVIKLNMKGSTFIKECTFDNRNQEQKEKTADNNEISTIKIAKSEGEFLIESSEFYDIGRAIVSCDEQAQNIIIRSNLFKTNIDKIKEQDFMIICSIRNQLNIENNINQYCGGIYIKNDTPNEGIISLRNNSFEHNKYGIYYQPTNKHQQLITNINMNNNTFNYHEKCMNIKLDSYEISLSNIIIKNCYNHLFDESTNLNSHTNIDTYTNINMNTAGIINFELSDNPIHNNILFNKVQFINNKFDNSCKNEKPAYVRGGGGIGLFVSADETVAAISQSAFTIKFEECIFSNNQAMLLNNEGVEETKGGSLYYVENDNEPKILLTSFVIDKCEFKQNSADKGGSIYIESCQNIDIFEITTSQITNNQCNVKGGSIYIDVSQSNNFSIHIKNNIMKDNKSYQKTGNIFINTKSDILIEDCIISNNAVSPSSSSTSSTDPIECKCGALFLTSQDQFSSILIKNCTFSDNKADCDFGALFIETINSLSHISVDNCTFIENKAGRKGAAVGADSTNSDLSSITFTQCIFENNVAKLESGAIFIENNGTFRLDSCTFVNNAASSQTKSDENAAQKGSCGSLYLVSLNISSEIIITDCNFEGNKAEENCGAIYFHSNAEFESTLSITNCRFTNNKAEVKCGAIFTLTNANSKMTITDCFFNDNEANSDFSDIYCDSNESSSSTTISKSTFLISPLKNHIGSIYFSRSAEFFVDSCSFTYPSSFKPLENKAREFYCIIINNNVSFSLNKCSFINIQEGSIKLIYSENTLIKGSKFDNRNQDQSKNQLPLIKIAKSEGEFLIESSEFYDIGRAIVSCDEQAQNIIILSNLFKTNIDKIKEQDFMIICSIRNQLNIENNINQYCGGIYIKNDTPNEGIISLRNNSFEHNKYGIYYQPTNKHQQRITNINMNNNTFNYHEKCMNIKLDSYEISLSNIIIKNCYNHIFDESTNLNSHSNFYTNTNMNTAGIINFELSDNPIHNNIVFNKVQFINNKFDDIYKYENPKHIRGGGGIGLLIITNEATTITNPSKFKIKFDECVFSNNQVMILDNVRELETEGGALCYDEKESEPKILLTSFIIDKCEFKQNSADKGGSIYIESCQNIDIFEITTSQITNNQCNVEGGSIYIDVSQSNNFSIHIKNNIMKDNKSYQKTGNIFINTKSDILIEDCTISNNFVSPLSSAKPSNTLGDIGALCLILSNPNSLVSLKNCEFNENKAENNYGAAYILFTDSCPYMSITNCKFRNNEAKNDDAALSVQSEQSEKQLSLLLENCLFEGNKAGNDCGSFSFNQSCKYATIMVVSCDFFTNEAKRSCGALHIDDLGNSLTCQIQGSRFVKNIATRNYGAIFIQANSKVSSVSLESGSVISNEAGREFGAIYVISEGEFSFDSILCINNTAFGKSSNFPETTDVLHIEGSGNSFVRNSEFVKGSFILDNTSYQISYVNNNKDSGTQSTFWLENCKISIINPNASQLFICNENIQGIVNIIGTSFTHFYTVIDDYKESLLLSSSQSLILDHESDEKEDLYNHVFLSSSCIGTINIQGSCFDTNEFIVLYGQDSNIDPSKMQISINLVKNTENVSVNEDCAYPEIIDQIAEYIGELEFLNRKDDKNTKKKTAIIVGSCVGVAAVIAIILIVVFIIRKRKKERELSENQEEEAETTQEDDIQNTNHSKLWEEFQSHMITQENPLFTQTKLNPQPHQYENDDSNEFEEEKSTA